LPHDLDDKLGQVGNASGYVASILREREEEWRQSLALLLAAGCSRDSIAKACRCIGGGWRRLEPIMLPDVVALHIDDGSEMMRAMRLDIAGSIKLASALVICAREANSGNDLFSEALRIA
jgi:hypothetical protein